MTTSELLEMHPAVNFKRDANISCESVLYRDLIEAEYNLTEYEKCLLRKNGFVVTERLKKDSFVEQLLDIWEKDLPLFISTDAILHAFHFYYDKILIEVELGILVDRLTTLLSELHGRLPDLADKYSTNTRMQRMLRDVDVYLTVPRKLLGQTVSPYYPDNTTEIDQILSLIDAENFDVYPFFSENCKLIDFSQFKPRGHYTEIAELQEYFRAMIWLGRIEIYLLPPEADTMSCLEQTPADIERQTIDAVLILELMDLAGVNSLYDEMEDILSFLVGEQDNVTPPNLRSVLESINLEDASQLLDNSVLQEFQDTLKTKAFAFQRILSQVLMHDPSSPDSVQPASAFILFGQRFVIDSYVTGNVVFDKIKYNDDFICRLFPSTLDVLFALGNDAAAQLLVPELDQYHYSTNLAGLRYLIDSYDSEFWGSSIYNMWLDSIRTLNLPSDRESLPQFMQTGAWWQQKMNTQLASWTELRHDNLLYAKQSYTPGYPCSYPCGYVEPFPELYQGLSELAKKAHDKFVDISFSDGELKTDVLDYFNTLQTVTDTLTTIARKELDQEPLNSDEISFMQGMLFPGRYGVMDGWYIKLLYGPSTRVQFEEGAFSDYLVADYHTTPFDGCPGNIIGWVSHAGTGPVDLAIVTATLPDANTVAFVGPVMSYYEYTTTDFQRLTDEEWENTYLSLATRPDWTNSYLANSSGEPISTKAYPDQPWNEVYCPIAHWKMDEIEGDIAYNSVDVNDGVLNGDPIWQPEGGMIAGALQFDGIDDYVETDFILNPADGAFSVFAWIKGGAPGEAIISQADTYITIPVETITVPGSMWLGADPNHGRLMTGLMDTAFGPLESDSVVTDDQWHHVGLVYNETTLKRHLYVDGTEVAVDAGVVGVVHTTGSLYFGGGPALDANTFFSGLIDDVRVYNVALIPEQIQELSH